MHPTTEPAHSEAYAQLLDLARGSKGALPREALARHVQLITGGQPWPVQRAAMEALLRRASFLEREGLRVRERPARGLVLGEYTTQRAGRGQKARPYRSWIEGVEPLRGTCGCPDYLKSSLGLCKHLLAIFQELFAQPGRVARARSEQARLLEALPRVTWDPVRPLEGRGPALGRVALPPEALKLRRFRLRWELRDGRWWPKPASLETPAGRMAIIADLESLQRTRRLFVGPEVQALALQTRARDEIAQVSASLLPSLKRHLQGFKRQIYAYQEQGVRTFLAAGRLMLADDMGLGKTTQAIAAAHALWRAGVIRRGLVVVPASLRGQWLREWRACTECPAALASGTQEERARQYKRLAEGFVIVGYEQLRRDLEVLDRRNNELVIIDEAQRIKNWATKTAQAVKQLQVPFRLVLTGTPLENRIDELASIFEWIDETALEPRWRLAPHHLELDSKGGPTTRGVKGLKALRQRMEGAFLRRIRQEVLDQLPARTDTIVPVALTDAQRAAHEELDQPIRILLARAHRRPLSQPEFLRLMSFFTQQRVICNGLAQRDFEDRWAELAGQRHPALDHLESPKLAELRELLAQIAIQQGRKVVVFSQWRRMLRLAHWSVSDLLAGEGLRAVFFTGAESTALRERALVEFNDDPATRVMFLTDAGGVGLNLQHAASCCVNLELPWNPAVLEQRVGRIHRLGQKKPIDVYKLCATEGIEARIATLLDDKRALFRGLFDGDSDEVRFEGAGSFIERIQHLLPPAPTPLSGGDEDGEVELRPVVDTVPEATIPEASPTIPALMKGVAVERGRDGSLVLRAEPQAAELLAQSFKLMAQLFEAAQRPTPAG